MRAVGAAFAALVVMAGSRAEARYFIPDLVKIPLDRLAANIERKIAEEPRKLHHRYALGRLYSMAWALKTTRIEAWRSDETPFFGSGAEAALFPPKLDSRPVESAELIADMARWIEKAIASYRAALEIDPDHAPSLLGLGWCLDAQTHSRDAVPFYRRAYRVAWELEKDEADLSDPCVACEAANYLLPKLDTFRDKEEIADITRNLKRLDRRPRAITPILVPLEDGLWFDALVDPSASTPFDLDGAGERKPWGWITPKAAWLVFDGAGTGRIESGLQMFGAVSFWIFWRDGYEALSALDGDGDGELRGAELRGLALWRDANGDGISQPGEVRPLAEWGIDALSCRGEARGPGLLASPQGAHLRDGGWRPTYDWSPKTNPRP